MHLFFIRHGQSHANLPDWDGYNRDESLTDLGLKQAAALEAWLPEHLLAPDVIYASTMQRARQTAEHVARAYNHDITFDDRLRELGNNRYDHSIWPAEEPPNRYARGYWATERPFAPIVSPGEFSETYMHFRTRVGLFLEEMANQHKGQRVIAVCHGGVIDAVFDHIFNVGPWRRCEVWTHNTGIMHLEFVEHPGREVWRLHFHNRTDHLVALEAS